MRRIVIISAAAAALAVAGVAAAAGGHGGHGGHGRFGGERLLQFDADKNGSVTRVEVDQGIQADFAAADTNQDGTLNADELKAQHDKRRAERIAQREAEGKPAGEHRERADRPDRGDPFKRLDWNLDGSVSTEEYAAPVRVMAARADRDGDGAISKEETEHRGGRRGHHGDDGE